MLNTQNRTPFISGHSAKKITFVYVKALTIMKTTRLFIIVFILTVRTAFANLQDDYILLILIIAISFGQIHWKSLSAQL